MAVLGVCLELNCQDLAKLNHQSKHICLPRHLFISQLLAKTCASQDSITFGQVCTFDNAKGKPSDLTPMGNTNNNEPISFEEDLRM